MGKNSQFVRTHKPDQLALLLNLSISAKKVLAVACVALAIFWHAVDDASGFPLLLRGDFLRYEQEQPVCLYAQT